jgi:hypothetical protein
MDRSLEAQSRTTLNRFGRLPGTRSRPALSRSSITGTRIILVSQATILNVCDLQSHEARVGAASCTCDGLHVQPVICRRERWSHRPESH